MYSIEEARLVANNQSMDRELILFLCDELEKQKGESKIKLQTLLRVRDILKRFKANAEQSLRTAVTLENFAQAHKHTSRIEAVDIIDDTVSKIILDEALLGK